MRLGKVVSLRSTHQSFFSVIFSFFFFFPFYFFVLFRHSYSIDSFLLFLSLLNAHRHPLVHNLVFICLLSITSILPLHSAKAFRFPLYKKKPIIDTFMFLSYPEKSSLPPPFNPSLTKLIKLSLPVQNVQYRCKYTCVLAHI